MGANAENVSFGCSDQACAIRQWANSAPHRANMLRKDVTTYGIASAVAANATADFDVTTAIAGDGTYCFALDGTGNGPVVYLSRESATPPRLVVQVAP